MNKLLSLKKELKSLSNDNKLNIFSLTYSERCEEHYQIIRHLLNPNEKHNLKDYFIKHIIEIIKDRCEINGNNYMDLNVMGYYITNIIPNDMPLQLTAVSITNKVFFIFIIETEFIDFMHSIKWKENYEKIINQINYIKQLYNTYQIIPVLIIDNENIGKRFNIFYTIKFDKIINIMKKKVKEKIKDAHYKFIIKEYIKAREKEFISFNVTKDAIPWEKYLKIYSRYAKEINNIQYAASTYYRKKLLSYIFKNKSFIENAVIMDFKADASSFVFLPSGLNDELVEILYKDSNILYFNLDISNVGIEISLSLYIKNNMLKQLRENLILLFNDKYNLLYEENEREHMYLLIHRLDIDVNTLICLDENTLIGELDRTFNNLSDKIISIKNIIHQIFSK